MITEKDIKRLKYFNTRTAKVGFYFFLFFPIFLLIMGGLNLQLASKLGKYAGYSLGDLLKSWVEGVDIHKQYSGFYIKAFGTEVSNRPGNYRWEVFENGSARLKLEFAPILGEKG